MKNVTKTNVFFTGMTLFYLIGIFTLRLIGTSNIPFNILLLLPEVFIIAAAVIYVKLLKPAYIKDMHMTMPDVRTVTETVLGTIAIVPFTALITIIVSLFSRNLVAETFSRVVDNSIWMNLLLLAAVPAICEEVIFRGLIMHGYKVKNPGKAIVISALLFALFHFNLNQFVYAFLLGIIFGILAYATGTVMTPIIAHFTFNGINVVNSYQFQNGYTIQSYLIEKLTFVTGHGIVFLMVMLVIVVVGFFLAKWFLKDVCNHNRGYRNVMRIFETDCLKYDGETDGKYFDGYLFIGIIVAIIYTFAY